VKYPRIAISAGDVAFSLELPPGLFADDPAAAPSSAGAPVALFLAVAEGPMLAVRSLSVSGVSSLHDLLERDVPEAAGQAFEDACSGGRSRSHSGLAWREEAGGVIRSRFAFECGGTAFLASAEAPAEMWGDYGVFAERAMMTIEVSDPSGPPTLALRPGCQPPPDGAPVIDQEAEKANAHQRTLRAAESIAAGMIASGDDAGAIAHVRAVDSDIRGAWVLARLFETALGAAGSAARAEELYALAREWGWRSIPSPQTAVEGEQHAEALAELEARLADLRGRQPAG